MYVVENLSIWLDNWCIGHFWSFHMQAVGNHLKAWLPDYLVFLKAIVYFYSRINHKLITYFLIYLFILFYRKASILYRYFLVSSCIVYCFFLFFFLSCFLNLICVLYYKFYSFAYCAVLPCIKKPFSKTIGSLFVIDIIPKTKLNLNKICVREKVKKSLRLKLLIIIMMMIIIDNSGFDNEIILNYLFLVNYCYSSHQRYCNPPLYILTHTCTWLIGVSLSSPPR